MSKAVQNLICFLIMTVIVIGLFYGFIKALEPDVPEVDHWEEYMIRSGDTLWSITPYKEGYDIRDLIDCIQTHNNISAEIFPGEIIELPVWENNN